MPYVLPAVFDAVPRSCRTGVSAAERAANASAAPLPGVPRRSRTSSNTPSNVRIGFTLVPPTPDHENDGPTSATGSSPGFPTAAMIATLTSPAALLHVSSTTPLPRLALGPRARRVRGRDSCDSLRDSVVFPAADPLADSTRANYVLDGPKHLPINSGKNGALRLSMEAIKATLSKQTREEKPDTTTPSTASTLGLRKKSGELVKPSLKHAHTLSGGFPTLKTTSMSRSAPATPTTPKFVHFDAQLEHVRLFLAEQKPLAVSRDGSPTETSEGEGNEFPWAGRAYSYNSSDDERARKMVRIKATTVPAHASIDGADVRVQSLVLAEDGASLVGRVLVRNLAFEKYVAIRFTFDWWQTTSEVSARYVDTVAPGIDRFGFSIKLGDVLHRIEEKTLFVAVRYTVAGREIWDSNHGQNYMVAFTKEKEQPPAATNAWGTKSRTRDQMSDLRKSLEKAMEDGEDNVPQLRIKKTRQHARGMSFGGFETKPSVASIVAETKPAKLGARYDFGAAPRERPSADGFRMPALDTFKRPEVKRAASDVPKRSMPTVSTENAKFDPKMCESPREREGMRMAPVETLVPSGGFDLAEEAAPARRHHHRAAYFDAWTFPAPGVKRTSSGAPAPSVPAPDQRSIPASWMDVTDLGGSLASTPSITSASSPSHSPSSPPEFLPSPEIDTELVEGLKLDVPRPDVDPSHYSSFLDRFCFFTGPATERRAHSRSSSDNYFVGYSESTERTLRAVSSSLSMTSDDLVPDVATTPRAGTPVAFETPLPVIAPALF